jgi:hypothetical protein
VLSRYDISRLDFIEEFLARNLDHCAEAVFSYFTFQVLESCFYTVKKRLWETPS